MATNTRYRKQAPTCSEIISSVAISNDEAETIITQYLDSIRTKDSVVSQLTRLQRNLRGLPSLLQGSELNEFDNDGGDEIAVSTFVPAPVNDGKISKEQRKKLKKERRKQEKKEKAAKSSKSEQNEGDSDEDMSE